MLIREATSKDMPQLKEIVDSSFPRFFRYFANHSLHSEGKILVDEDDEASGFAKLIAFHVNGCKFGCILWLAVHPTFSVKLT